MKSKKKICIVCPYPVGVAPSQRLKYEQYFDHFEANGYEIDARPFMTRKLWNIVYQKGQFIRKMSWTFLGYLARIRLLFRLHKYDCTYIHLWVTPFGSTLFEFLTCTLSRKVIYDIDDLVYLKPASKTNPFLRLIKSSQKPIMLMKRAEHVITCTPHLDSFVKKYNSKTTDISSTINTSTYLPKNDYSNDRTLTIGWSGSLSTSKYLAILSEILTKLKQENDFNLLVIGDPNFTLADLKVEAIKWEASSEVADLQRIDIGLYPLPDEEWVLGKSGLKALQYMALGIPTIAKKVGANLRVIEDGVSGYLVESEEEWLNKLTLLMQDEALRRTIGAEARKRVEKYYSIDSNKDRYLGIIKKVLND